MTVTCEIYLVNHFIEMILEVGIGNFQIIFSRIERLPTASLIDMMMLSSDIVNDYPCNQKILHLSRIHGSSIN